MIPRRRFIKQSGFAAASLLAGNALLGACSKRPQEAKIGLQLFTMRDDLAEDAKKTLMKIANIGYGHVETFYDYQTNRGSGKFWDLSTSDLKKVLADNNLQSFSGHYSLNNYLAMGKGNDEELKEQVEVAANLGQKYFVIPVPPMQLIDKLTLPDFQFMAEQLNKGGEYCKQAGLKIGYHNHFWEFRGSEGDSQTGYDILLNQTEPDLVTFELDLFWTVKSGVDPVELFNNYPKRFEMWHVKDIDQSKPDVIVGPEKDALSSMDILGDIRFTEVGSGTVDFKGIFKAADKAGLKHFFVEQDGIYMDNHYESIRRSFHYVQDNLI